MFEDASLQVDEGGYPALPSSAWFGSDRGAASVGPGAVGGEQDSDPVVGEVPEAVGEPSGLLDDAVDGLGAAVRHPAGGEVREDLFAPAAQGLV